MHAILRALQNPKKIKMKGRLWRAFICLFDDCSLEKILKLIIMVGRIHFLWKAKWILGFLIKLPFECCENHLQRSLKILGWTFSLCLAVLHGDLHNILLSIQALVTVLAASLRSHFNFWPQRADIVTSTAMWYLNFLQWFGETHEHISSIPVCLSYILVQSYSFKTSIFQTCANFYKAGFDFVLLHMLSFW